MGLLLPINELIVPQPLDVCTILNLHRCKELSIYGTRVDKTNQDAIRERIGK